MRWTPAIALAGAIGAPAGVHADAWPEPALEAASAYEAGRYGEAREKYEQTVLAGEGRPEIVFNLGAARYRAAEGDSAGLAAALADFRRAGAAAGAPLESDARYNAATMQALLGDIDAAIDGYKDVLRRNPADHDARYNLELLQRMREQQPLPQQQPQPGDGEEQERQEGEQNERQESGSPDEEQPPEGGEPEGQEQPQPGEDEQPPPPASGEEPSGAAPEGQEQPQPATPPQQSTISREEALRQLDKLEEAERDLLRQLLLQRQRRADVEKDW